MISTDSIRTMVGIIGNVISFGLLLSPLPTFMTIVRKKSVEQFSPIPYLATLLNCMMWVVYALPIVHPNILRLKILGILAAELVIFSTVLACVLAEVHTYDTRTEIVGILCVIFGTARWELGQIRYTAFVSKWFPKICIFWQKTVIETKSVKYMPLSLSFVSFLNGICWMFYALLRFDLYILIPNGLGALLSAAQLILYFIFYRTTPKDEPMQNLELPDVTPTSAPDSFN